MKMINNNETVIELAKTDVTFVVFILLHDFVGVLSVYAWFLRKDTRNIDFL